MRTTRDRLVQFGAFALVAAAFTALVLLALWL